MLFERITPPAAPDPDRTTPSGPGPRVLYVTPELADYAKAGGLGEVAAALPRALQSFCDVRILIPGYRPVLEKHRFIPVISELPPVNGIPGAKLGRLQTPDGLTIYVVLNSSLYDRGGSPYCDSHGQDWPDNDIRFGRLSAAAADLAAGIADPDWKPDHLHLNDWPTALAAGYVAWRRLNVPTLLTVHNLAYHGVFSPSRLEALGIPWEAFRMDGVEFYGQWSFLKAGLYYASQITTVSSTYAEEITRPEHGHGLDGLLKLRSAQGRLSGILNGIDESWDPTLEAQSGRFDLSRWKSCNAAQVRRDFGLAVSRGPLFAIVSRLVRQKGTDLAIEAADAIVRNGGQLVVTGRGESDFEHAIADLGARYPGAVGVRIGFDDREARRVFAGSDFLLMPSRFEPCGLAQMYAQKCGSLPIAHKTGGLAETVADGLTGFLFEDYSLRGLVEAIGRGLATYRSTRKIGQMRRSAMSQAFSWTDSALQYSMLYRAGVA